jgi:hypothetical protein
VIVGGETAGVLLCGAVACFFAGLCFLARRGAGAGGMLPIARSPTTCAGAGAGTRTSPVGFGGALDEPPPATRNASAKSTTATAAVSARRRGIGGRVRITSPSGTYDLAAVARGDTSGLDRRVRGDRGDDEPVLFW